MISPKNGSVDGPFPTEGKIADLMASWVISGENIQQVTDPACGAGAILSEVEDSDASISVRGFDISEQAVESTRRRLDANGGIKKQDFFDFTGSFEAVVLDPPILNHFESEKKNIDIDGPGRWGLHHYFVLRSLKLLEDSGRAAILFPTNSIGEEFLKHITEEVRLDRIISLSDTDETATPFSLFLCTKTMSSRKVKVISLDSWRTLDRSLVFKDSEALSQTQGNHFRELSPQKIIDHRPQQVLSLPEIVDLEDSSSLTALNTYFEIKFGVKSGNNSVYYIEEKEAEKVDEELLVPLIKIRPSGFTITDSDIDKYFLDLGTVSKYVLEEEFFSSLEEEGYEKTQEYLRKHQDFSPSSDTPPTNPDKNPDLIRPLIAHDTFYRVNVDQDTTFDSNYAGLYSKHPEKYLKVLWKYLNTDIHRKISVHAESGTTVRRLTLQHLRRQPVPNEDLIEDLMEKTDDLDLKSRHDIKKFERKILKILPDPECEILRNFRKHDQQLKWGWALSEEEFEIFSDLYDKEIEEAQEFLAERVESDDAEDILQSVDRTPISSRRSSLLKETLKQFREENYQIFLISALTQIEGLLLDIATRKGWRIEQNKLKKGQEGILNIQLSDLIENFVEDPYNEFLQEYIRDWRNDIAHGKITVNTEKTAKVVFCALSALIRDYDKYISKG